MLSYLARSKGTGAGMDSKLLRTFVDSNDSFYGPNTLMSPWIGNHDLGRIIHAALDTPLWGSAYDSGQGQAFQDPPLGLPDALPLDTLLVDDAPRPKGKRKDDMSARGRADRGRGGRGGRGRGRP